MREIGIEQLRAKIGAELKDLPFTIMVRGRAVAVVQPYSSNLKVQTKDTNLKNEPYSSTPDLKVQDFTPEPEDAAIQAKDMPPDIVARVKPIEGGKLPKKVATLGAKYGGHDPHRIGRGRMTEGVA